MAEDGYWTALARRGVRRRGFLTGGAAALTAAMAAAAGCSSGNNSSKPAATAGSNARVAGTVAPAPPTAQALATADPALANAKRGGTFNIDQPDEPISLDNHRQETPGSIQAANLVYNHLLKRAEDFVAAPGIIYVSDELASGWEQVDKLTYRFSLVKNAKWHNTAPVNGRPFTADDVKYSIDRMRGSDPELRTRSAWAPVDKVEAPDPNTVVVTTKQPYAAFIAIAGHTWSIIMPHELADTPDVNRKAIGTGPFLFKDWQSGVALHFDRNPEYFRSGQPFLDHVVMRVVPDLGARTANFRAGETEIWGGSPPTIPFSTIDEIKNSLPDVNEIKRTGSNNSGTKAFFNTTAPPFNDKRVRQAFLYGADYDSMIKIFGGLAQRAGPMPLASVWGLKESDFPKTDVAKAKALLEAAGFTADKPLRVKTTISRQYSGPAVSQILQQVMKPVGVTIDIDQIEDTAWITQVYRGGQNYQMTSFGDWSWEDPDRGLYAYFHSDGNANNTHYTSTQADALLEQQRGEFDLDARKKIVRDLQLLLVDDAPNVWLVSTGTDELARKRFRNYKQMQMGNSNSYREWENCWFDPLPNS
ncbi:MAG TPA: ABC transporter substrate-binding protein [Dehalococcoidia bacterium]|nr:ABC transporter substrate-binding protein [Dehalococcoidia bacterium]